MLCTPFGPLRVTVDGVPAAYTAVPHVYPHPPVLGHPLAGCWRIVIPAKGAKRIRLALLPDDETLRGCGTSGEDFLGVEFERGALQMTLGAWDEGADARYETTSDAFGVQMALLGQLDSVVFGVAWADDFAPSDVRTWYAADPSMDP